MAEVKTKKQFFLVVAAKTVVDFFAVLIGGDVIYGSSKGEKNGKERKAS